MKKLIQCAFDAGKCRSEWHEFSSLVSKTPELMEQRDILPFFKQSTQLSLWLGSNFPSISEGNCLAHEFPIYGDFVADLVVGDSTRRNYLLVEFEDGTPESIFKRQGKKTTSNWSPRFEAATSQLIDWLWKLDDMRGTGDFQRAFGDRDARFHGLIVCGKDMMLSDTDSARLRWRTTHIKVNSVSISTMSFNELVAESDAWLTRFYGT